MRVTTCVVVVLVVLAATACGGTGGSVMGSSERCSSRGGSGVCEGRFGTLKGTYGHDIEVGDLGSGTLVDVHVAVSVEEGSVEISITEPDGDALTMVADGGAQSTLHGVTELDGFGEFEVTFTALEELARGVAYVIDWQVR